MAKAWMTSSDIIEAVKRKISYPFSQNTMSEEDILKFANEEMAINQVPSVMQFHEEYFVTIGETPLLSSVSRYPIPERAIGQKLRDLFYKDSSGNYQEMSRISSEDKAFFQGTTEVNSSIHKYYFEGNDIVLVPQVGTGPTGSLSFSYFLRPNQLVQNDRAAIVNAFTKDITIINSSIVAGDTVTIDNVTFTAVSGAPSTNEFQIGATSTDTASNLVAAITANDIVEATNGSPATAVISLFYPNLSTVISVSNSIGFIISSGTAISFDLVPTIITNESVVDFLQERSGHKTKAMDITIPKNGVTGNIITFNTSDVPTNLIVGDYICLAGEAIIPQIPTDLHTVLADRVCLRILTALGDEQGLNQLNGIVQNAEVRTGTLIDSRSDGSPQKITGRHSLLHYSKMGPRRRI